jgi:tRNA-dihydrouridine synthase
MGLTLPVVSTVVVVSASSDPASAATASGPATSVLVGPLHIGPITVDPPVVLAPMAGVTNLAFRQLCQRFGQGLFVSEMVNARGLLEDGEKTWQLASFGPEETRRSLQLYGTDPAVMGAAVRRLVAEDHVDHIDLNFGCPAPKVTRHGGGAAVPARPALCGAVVAAAVDNAGAVPVTVTMRIGLDDDRVTFLEAGRRAADAGAAAVALHARTALRTRSAPVSRRTGVANFTVLCQHEQCDARHALLAGRARLPRGTGRARVAVIAGVRLEVRGRTLRSGRAIGARSTCGAGGAWRTCFALGPDRSDSAVATGPVTH